MFESLNIVRRHAFLSVVILVAMLVSILFHYLPAIVITQDSAESAHFRPLWSYQTKKQILTEPIFVNDVIVFGTYDGSLQALSAIDGTEVWFIKFPDPIFSLSHDKEGVIYVGTGLHYQTKSLLNAIDSKRGRLIWQQEFTGHLEEPPLVDEQSQRLWITSGPSGLWSLNRRNGNILWHQEIGHADTTPLLHNDVLYAPAQKSETLQETVFYALNPDDGTIQWTNEQPGQPWASPIIDKTGQVIFTNTGIGQIGLARETDKGWAQAISTKGRTLWQSTLPGMALTPNIYLPEEGLVIYVTKDGSVSALHSSDGSKAWEMIKLKTHFSSPAAIVTQFKEKVVAVTADDGDLFMFDAITGRFLYRQLIAESTSSAILVHDRIIYIRTTHGITALVSD